MRVRIDCPGCQRPLTGDLPPLASLDCDCGATVPLHGEHRPEAGRPLTACLRCGGQGLYVKKAFPHVLGCLIMVVAAGFSVVTYGLSLLACLLIDLGLYWIIPWQTCCYACETVHSGVPRNPAHQPFDLNRKELHLYGQDHVPGSRPGPPS